MARFLGLVINFGWHLALYERYVRCVLDRSGMRQAKSTLTPRSKEAMVTPEHAKKKFLDTYSHRDCRSVAGLRQFVSKMRYDTTFATEEVMRDALNPTMGSLRKSWESRDTSKVDRDVLSFRWATEGTITFTVMVDSGWVGCTRTRCSTSSRVLKMGDFTLKNWSVTQTTTSLSSAGAEAKAITKGCVEDTCVKKKAGTAQPGALDRRLECGNNLTTIWTWKTINTAPRTNDMGTANVKAKHPEGTQRC